MNAYIDALNQRIETLNEAIWKSEERRDILIAERDEALQRMFEKETGLREGCELEITQEFETFDFARGNLGSYWRADGRQLVIDTGSAREYFQYQTISVAVGGIHAGGVPIALVQRMREAWVEKHVEKQS